MKNSINKKQNNFSKNTNGIHIVAFLLFALFSLFITYPLIFHLNNYATGAGDELVMAWIHNWVIHALATNPLSLFQANLYYPYHNTLAFADSLIFTSILALPLQLLLKDPIVSVNYTLITSITFLGFSIYLLSYYLTKNYLAAILAGVLVIFSPAVLGYTTHLQNLAVPWIPLSILSFLHFIKTTRTKFFLLTLVFFLFQLYNSIMPAYFIVVSLFIILTYHWFFAKQHIYKLVNKKNGILLVVTCLLIIPLIYPYYAVSKEFKYVRDIRDAIHFAVQPEDLFYPSNHTRLSALLVSLPFNQSSQNNEFKAAYIGLVFSLLSIITLCYFIKTIKKKNLHVLKSFCTIALAGLIISFGPVLHLGRQTIHEPFVIPLPYALFYYILPGFQGFRNSARWEMLFILAMAIASAIVLTLLLKNISVIKRNALLIFLVIGTIAEFNFPMHFVPVPQRKDFPKVHQWLNSTAKESVILYMPIYNWGSWPFTQSEIYREYYGTVHFRKSVNGYTSFSPPQWQDFIRNMDNEFPNEVSVKIIKQLGVNYIIVDTELYDKSYKAKLQKVNGQFVVNSLIKNPEVKLVNKLENNYVFQVQR